MIVDKPDIYTREEDSKLHISSAQLGKKIASKEISVVLGSQMLSKQSQEGHKSERGPDERLFALYQTVQRNRVGDCLVICRPTTIGLHTTISDSQEGLDGTNKDKLTHICHERVDVIEAEGERAGHELPEGGAGLLDHELQDPQELLDRPVCCMSIISNLDSFPFLSDN